MKKLLLLLVVVPFVLFAQSEKSIKGNWQAKTSEYTVHYKVYEFKDKFYGKITYVVFDGEGYSLSKDEQYNALKAFVKIDETKYEGKYFDPEEDETTSAELKIINEKEMKLIIRSDEGEYTETLKKIN